MCFNRLFLLFFCLLFVTCKKKKDEKAPQVNILLPAEEQVFTVNDTIHVRGSAIDETQLYSIQVKVLDMDGIPVLEDRSINPNNKYMNVIKTIPIDNEQLKSAYYNILVQAYDGVNMTKVYKKIYIKALPLKREAVYIVSSDDNVKHTVYKLSESNYFLYSHTLKGDFLGATVNNFYHQFNSLGQNSPIVYAYSIKNAALAWSLESSPNKQSLLPYYTSFCANSKHFVTGNYLGKVVGYANMGSNQYQASYDNDQSVDYYPVNMLLTQKYLLSSFIHIDGTQPRKFLLFGYPLGNTIQELSNAPNTVAIFEKENEKMLLFCQQNPAIKLYNAQQNNILDIKEFNETITGAVQISSDTYIISTNTGIYKYEYQIGSIVKFLNEAQVSIMKIDNHSQELLLAVGKTLKSYDYNTGVFRYSVAHSENIRAIDIKYNREP